MNQERANEQTSKQTNDQVSNFCQYSLPNSIAQLIIHLFLPSITLAYSWNLLIETNLN